MLSGSEIVLNATIWALTGAGLFFGLRARWRRRKHPSGRPADVRRPAQRNACGRAEKSGK